MSTHNLPFHDARDRLSNSLRHMVNDAEDLLHNAQQSGNEEFNAARVKFEARVHQARAELDTLTDSTIDNAKRAARATDHAVHEHPYTSMGLAAGVGVLMGMLISRR